MEAEYFDHRFNGKIVYIPDTQQSRDRHPYYFDGEYHHYTYYCKSAYRFGSGESVHLYVKDVIPGKETNRGLEREKEEERRINFPLRLVEIYNPDNKDMKHVLTKFDD